MLHNTGIIRQYDADSTLNYFVIFNNQGINHYPWDAEFHSSKILVKTFFLDYLIPALFAFTIFDIVQLEIIYEGPGSISERMIHFFGVN
jgi:hypothetical protein